MSQKKLHKSPGGCLGEEIKFNNNQVVGSCLQYNDIMIHFSGFLKDKGYDGVVYKNIGEDKYKALRNKSNDLLKALANSKAFKRVISKNKLITIVFCRCINIVTKNSCFNF